MADQIAAHERYLRARSELNEALERGDPDTGRLQADLQRAERDWHRLVRAADDAMRAKRPR